VPEAASPAEIRAAALNQPVRPNVERPRVLHHQASVIGVVASLCHAETRGARDPLPADAKGSS
jgi:hypothetical protein